MSEAEDLARIRKRLAEYYEPQDAETWLHSPQQLLHGHRPADLIHVGRTADVERLLDQLDNGTYL